MQQIELRDWLAGQALNGLIVQSRPPAIEQKTFEDYADWSYEMADAMLQCREEVTPLAAPPEQSAQPQFKYEVGQRVRTNEAYSQSPVPCEAAEGVIIDRALQPPFTPLYRIQQPGGGDIRLCEKWLEPAPEPQP